MQLIPVTPPKTKTITLNDVFEWAYFDSDTWATVSHFVNTATNNRLSVTQFVEYMRYTYGLYVINNQTISRASGAFTPETFSETFTECFGTGALFTSELHQYLQYINDEKTVFETLIKDGEHTVDRSSQNSGGVATASDFTKTSTPSGNVTTLTTGTLSETVNISLGSWDSSNLQGSEQHVTSGSPSTTETVTDLKVLTERTTGNTGTSTDTRKTETDETLTFEDATTRSRTETGGNNDIIKRSLLSYFGKLFVTTFCVTCYNID